MADPTGDQLRSFVGRILRLIAERKGVSDDIRDVYAEAKAFGFDAKILRKAVARAGMRPDDRAEADLLLETYEAALAGDDVPIPDARPDVAALAASLLSAQIVGIEDAEQAAALVEHVLYQLDLRAEIAVLREQEGDRRKLAKLEGFDTNQMGATIRWLEKCAKHGVEMMRAGEAVFDLYRGTMEAHQANAAPIDIADPKLSAMFAAKPPAKNNRKIAAAVNAAALARAAREAREE